MKKILVCDDQPSFNESLIRGLMGINFVAANFDVVFFGNHLGLAIKALESRMKKPLKEKSRIFLRMTPNPSMKLRFLSSTTT